MTLIHPHLVGLPPVTTQAPGPRVDRSLSLERFGTYFRLAGGSRIRALALGPSAPPENVMVELTFGFWVLMTSSRNAPLAWQPHLEQVFPAGSNRQQIYSGLVDLRKLRNRVAHTVNRAELNGSLRRMRCFTNYMLTGTDGVPHIDKPGSGPPGDTPLTPRRVPSTPRATRHTDRHRRFTTSS